MDEKQSRLLGRAIAIAAEAHQNQRDKAGTPYILHPLRMMEKARTTEEKIVAILHDVVEDSEEPHRWTKELLRDDGFPSTILEAVDALTHREGEEYEDAITRVLANDLAMQVKLLDLEDNMTLTRLSQLTEKDLERVQKYHRAHQRIMEKLAEQKGSAGPAH